MKKKIGVFFIILAFLFPIWLVAQNKIKVIDIDSQEPISFVIMITNENEHRVVSDIDGLIDFVINRNYSYTFKRLGYKDIRISGTQLVNSSILKMEMLPIELCPIVVTANAAWSDLNRAIENSFNSIPELPIYLKCFQNDKVLVSSSVEMVGAAIYATKVSKLFDKGKGCSSFTKLIGLKVEPSNNLRTEFIGTFSYYDVPFVNDFLVGEKRRYDVDLSYYYVDVNDSILIIGYSPKSNFIPKSYIITSGRFLIDKRDWKLLRIDSDLNPRMLKYQNEKVMADQKKEMFYQKLNRSIYFAKNGLPTKIEERLEYSLKKDQKKLIRTNITTHVYKNITEKEFEAVPMKKAERKSILFQKPYFTSTFDTEFDEGFQ